ncbi:glycosyltransferase family 2 protein [Rhizobium puerariae]|uniref:Glycosyltransferase family 2 protein n=1 Tax=Rhizobium puerariae TaxID=1585791 RepID=A0ABV6ABZ4_9HYPH
MQKSKLAVVFPVFNGEATLEKSLQCIADQDCPEFRAYIIDNKSTDGSREIARQFCARDSRFEIIEYEEHLDVIGNFIRAMKIGRERGEFFCLRACDDLSSPDYLSKLLAAIEADERKLLATGSTERIHPDGVRTLRPNEATLDFFENLKTGKVAKSLFFPSEWFYGIVRSRDGADIMLERWSLLGSPWCAASFTVAEFVMRGKVVWVDGPIYQFFEGSGSESRYMAKSLRDKIRQRWTYAIGCYRVVEKLQPLPLWTRMKIFRMCWRDAGRKTRYRLRRHLRDSLRKAVAARLA